MTTDPFNTPAGRAWSRDVLANLTPKIRQSAMVVQIAPDVPDPKSAVELGYSTLLDKPLVVVVPPGRKIPEHLARAADELVEWCKDPAEMGRRIDAAYRRCVKP